MLDVRYYSDSDKILRRSEATPRARSDTALALGKDRFLVSVAFQSHLLSILSNILFNYFILRTVDLSYGDMAMNKIALTTLALLGLTDLALAADLPMKAPPMVAPAAYNWNGFYAGANVGYGWEKSTINSFTSVGVFSDTVTGNRSGVFGGFQGGYNWQVSPNWLIGGEADWQGSDIKGSISACTATGCSFSNTQTNDFGTIRARFGYVANNVLFYGTGGFAFADIASQRAVVCVVAGGGTCPGGPSPSALTGMVASATGMHVGWSAGGGVEWGLLPNWTVKVEYLHMQFHDAGSDFTYPGFPTAFRHNNATDSYDTVRVGVNYLFSIPPAPVVAKF